jgi:hypothetical protein
MSKKNVLIISSAYVIFFLAIFVISEYCGSTWCRVHDDDPLGIIFFLLLPLLPTFFLSLITYRMKDEVFRAWWGFARWWVPIIIVVTLLLENAGGGGGIGISGAVSGAFDALIIGILYVILIVTSLVKILWAYLKNK